MDLGVLIGWLPLWAVFLLTLALCLGSVEGGAALARLLLARKMQREPEGPLGSLVTALLGLLAFMLAFTFGMTGTRFEARKQLVLAEANAIGTTYLRAGLMPPKQGREIRRLLREYADLRLQITPQNVGQMLLQAEEVHGALWKQATSLAEEKDADPQLRALFVVSLNELIDLHQSRKTVALQQRIPGTVWSAVYLLSALAMAASGFQIGMSGSRRMLATPLLAAAFSLVVALNADMERPGEGLMLVSQQPIADVRQAMLNDSL